LRQWSDDKDLFEAGNHGEFLLHGFRNRDLEALLYDAPAALIERGRSAAVSRKLGLVRAHIG
jgi:hypothetical protein